MDTFLHMLTYTSVNDIMHMKCVNKFYARIQCIARMLILYQESSGGGGFPGSIHHGVLEYVNNKPLSIRSNSKIVCIFNDDQIIHLKRERGSVITGTVPAGPLGHVLVGYTFKTKCGCSFEECMNNSLNIGNICIEDKSKSKSSTFEATRNTSKFNVFSTLNFSCFPKREQII